MNIITHKLCSKCKIEKEIHFFNKDKYKKDGLVSKCKICTNEYYKLNKDHLDNKQREYRKSNKKERALYQKEYYQDNKIHINNRNKESNKIWRDNNKERISAVGKIWRAKNKESRIQYDKKYRIINKISIANRQKVYFKTPKGIAATKNTNHKRRTLTNNGDVTTEQIMELQDYKFCYWCNKSLKHTKVHIDHYEPLSKGGEHTLSNLVVSCAKCNLTKNVKDPIQFANSIGKLL